LTIEQEMGTIPGGGKRPTTRLRSHGAVWSRINLIGAPPRVRSLARDGARCPPQYHHRTWSPRGPARPSGTVVGISP